MSTKLTHRGGSLGHRLARERKRLGLSQAKVGQLCSVSRSTVGMIETGGIGIDSERLLQLGGHGFDVLYLLTGEDGKVAAGRLIDWDLVGSIVSQLGQHLSAAPRELSPERQALLVKHLYLQAATRNSLDDMMIDEAVRLAG